MTDNRQELFHVMRDREMEIKRKMDRLSFAYPAGGGPVIAYVEAVSIAIDLLHDFGHKAGCGCCPFCSAWTRPHACAQHPGWPVLDARCFPEIL